MNLLFVKICVSKTLFCQKRKIREMHFPLQATLHVGDEIREINGISVANQVYDEKITLSMHYNVPLHIYDVTIMHIHTGWSNGDDDCADNVVLMLSLVIINDLLSEYRESAKTAQGG